MKTITVYTNLYSGAVDIGEIRNRGEAARFHTTPEGSRADSRDGDFIAEVTFTLPEDAGFIFYTARSGFTVYSQSDDFVTAYEKAAAVSRRDAGGPMSTAVTTANTTGAGTSIIPLSRYAATLQVLSEAPLKAAA